MKTFKSLVSKHFPNGGTLLEVLTKMTGKPQNELQDAAFKGAVWLQKGKGKILRERDLNFKLKPQDTVSLFFDPRVLSLPAVNKAECLFENDRYGVWMKEAGVVPQGTQTGDHASLLRYVELHRKKEVYLVHRLDRETAGLMIIAYSGEAAGKLSDLFQKNQIHKQYEAIVLGEIPKGSKRSVDESLDGKVAVTHFEVLEAADGKSRLRIQLETGRLHQIRRHLEFIGHPILGDPKYGRGNKNKDGLRLLAQSLTFVDPWDKKSKTYATGTSLSL